MEIYIVQYNFEFKCFVVMNENTHVSVFKYEKYKFDLPIPSFGAKNIFSGKSRVNPMTLFLEQMTILLLMETLFY